MLEEVVIRNGDWRIPVAVIKGSFLCGLLGNELKLFL
jgi:hypothetical protein